MKLFSLALASVLAASAAAQLNSDYTPTGPFALKDGDRVVFYGDSITEQRLYSAFTEAFVLTRFPKLKVSFVHSGVGGDRVTGGWMGDIATRLTKDVVAYKPTVVTIMLGMNDASYRPFDQGLFDTYRTGYESIVGNLKSRLPGVRFTLIRPSPYDDVTRPLSFDGGYNAVLLRYSDAVSAIAAKNGATVADLNAPVVQMLEKANATNPENAQKIIPDRVHPGAQGHLIMAEGLLKAWNAPSIVSAVSVDAASSKVTGQTNTQTSGLASDGKGGFTWTQKDAALPFPIDLDDPVTRLTMDSSDFFSALNRQMLTVTGLPVDKTYALKMESLTPMKFAGVGPAPTFTGAQLAAGVNLAPLKTPMWSQAREVFRIMNQHLELHQLRWRNIDFSFQNEAAGTKERDALIRSFDAYEKKQFEAAQATAQPVAYRYTLTAQP
ncbi:GDSL family lipase [bacterium]|nr:MAG: GDSL family lipase [bacterium]